MHARKWFFIVALVVVMGLLLAGFDGQVQSVSAGFTPTATSPAEPTATSTAEPTATNTAEPSPTPTSTPQPSQPTYEEPEPQATLTPTPILLPQTGRAFGGRHLDLILVLGVALIAVVIVRRVGQGHSDELAD